jgi:Domain of unknown function (DUF4265)
MRRDQLVIDLDENIPLVKVRFRVDKDPDGFPPVDVEPLSAMSLGGGRFEICSCPFFVRDIAYGDVVIAAPREGNAIYEYVKMDSYSGRKSLCIIVLSEEANSLILAVLKESSFFFEYQALGHLTLVGVSGFPDAEWEQFYAMLLEQQRAETVSVAKLSN